MLLLHQHPPNRRLTRHGPPASGQGGHRAYGCCRARGPADVEDMPRDPDAAPAHTDNPHTRAGPATGVGRGTEMGRVPGSALRRRRPGRAALAPAFPGNRGRHRAAARCDLARRRTDRMGGGTARLRGCSVVPGRSGPRTNGRHTPSHSASCACPAPTRQGGPTDAAGMHWSPSSRPRLTAPWAHDVGRQLIGVLRTAPHRVDIPRQTAPSASALVFRIRRPIRR